ncbi:MAG: hypothetical protein NT091_02200 [Candidatus Falkowbacteria bacterium]|nr:hypothetical protein [Candidatus Falkowbacteria bacterium]
MKKLASIILLVLIFIVSAHEIKADDIIQGQDNKIFQIKMLPPLPSSLILGVDISKEDLMDFYNGVIQSKGLKDVSVISLSGFFPPTQKEITLKRILYLKNNRWELIVDNKRQVEEFSHWLTVSLFLIFVGIIVAGYRAKYLRQFHFFAMPFTMAGLLVGIVHSVSISSLGFFIVFIVIIGALLGKMLKSIMAGMLIGTMTAVGVIAGTNVGVGTIGYVIFIAILYKISYLTQSLKENRNER